MAIVPVLVATWFRVWPEAWSTVTDETWIFLSVSERKKAPTLSATSAMLVECVGLAPIAVFPGAMNTSSKV